MVRHKTYSYEKAIGKLEEIKTAMIIVENTNDIYKRIMFGDLNGKTINLPNNQVAFIDEEKEIETFKLIKEVYKFDIFVYKNFSVKTYEKHFCNYMKEVLLGERITRQSIDKNFLDKFPTEIISVTYGKQVFGLNIARKNLKPFNLAGFEFYLLPTSIKGFQENYELIEEDIETLSKYSDHEWVFKTKKGYDIEKVRQEINDDINKFIFALQFTSNEFRETNVNLYNNTNREYLLSFTFKNFKFYNDVMQLNTEVYNDCTLREDVKEKYLHIWNIFEKDINERIEIENCILRAIEWTAKSSVENSTEIAITECFIALETLFNGKIKNSRITNTLEKLAVKCLDNKEFDVKIFIRDCYDNRSQVVHGHDYKENRNLKNYFIEIVKEIIFYIINNYERFAINTGKDLLKWVENIKN